MWKLARAVLILLAATTSANAVEVRWGAKVELRDGVELNATLYLPEGRERPVPSILMLTPYISDSYHDRAMYFSERGFAFAIVDARGRGNSDGTYEPQPPTEGRDGADVIAWLRQQPFADGQVAMWGGSNSGWNQWMTAAELPEGLVTIVPAAAAAPGIDTPTWGGIPNAYSLNWLALTAGRTSNDNLFWSDPVNRPIERRYREHRAFADLPGMVNINSDMFSVWLDHPLFDEYWRARNPSKEAVASLDIPVLSITGLYDGDQVGALWHAERYVSAVPDAAHYLLIGPWDHPGTRSPQTELGGRTFHEKSAPDLNAYHLQWYDWVMRDGPLPSYLQDRVNFFVPGLDSWLSSPSLGQMADEPRSFYLSATSEADGRGPRRAAKLGSRPATPSTASYTWDPLQEARGLDRETDAFLVDRGPLDSAGDEALVFVTDPFPEATILAGRPVLELWLTLDTPDTDISATLYLQLPDGTTYLESMGLIRLRHRDGLDSERLWTPGETERVVIDESFLLMADLAPAGSRLFLVLEAPNHPRRQVNYNAAIPVSMQTGDDARTARVSVHFGGDRASRLILPTRNLP